MSSPTHRIKSASKMFRIIDALDQVESAGVTELAQQTGIAKSSVYKYLDTLNHLGFVNKSEQRYSLSFRFFQIGHHIREGCELFRKAKPHIDELARRTGETVSLVIEENRDAVYIYQISDSKTAHGLIEEGDRIPIVRTPTGKAILSYRPETEITELLGDDEPLVDTDKLLAELQAIRSQRIIVNQNGPPQDQFSAGALEGHRHVVGHDPANPDLNSVSVPIRDATDYAVGAVEVSGPKSGLHGQRLEGDIASLLVNTGKAIETDLLS